MLTRETVLSDATLAETELIRARVGTVFRLSDDETRAMERLWGIASLFEPRGAVEGERRLRSHFVRERSSRLRADKLREARGARGRLRCEICGEEEGARYPADLADAAFEVHHKAPLGELGRPKETTLDSLAVLCANCHRSVHATGAVDENFERLRAHFGSRGS